MKKYITRTIFLAFVMLLGISLVGCGNQPAKEATTNPEEKALGQILMSSTIGPIDAGIVAALEDAFEQKTGIKMRHVGAGTGEALKIAKGGSVDLVMVHAKKLEEQFVADGFGTERIDLMYNDFVIVGPAEDPAQIKGLKSVSETLQKIANAKATFITRGDNSGTHVKEMELWEAAGIKPEGSWYQKFERGAEGNVATLKFTDEQNAYTMMDRATYLTVKNDIKLQVLVEKDESMLNFISLIPVNPEKFPSVQSDLVKHFIEFATSKEGQTIIKEFGVDKYGEPLFFPNSEIGKTL